MEIIKIESQNKLYNYISLIIIIILIVFLFYIINRNKFKNNSEYFDPYFGNLAPEIINSTSGFDFPNQFGETLEPYQYIKNKTENQLFNQINDLDIRN